MREALLVSNGPGELYTWTRPVLRALRATAPDLRVVIALIPCQFAGGNEVAIARTFGADAVLTPAQSLRLAATGTRPAGVGGGPGFVLSLGGSADLAVRLGGRLGYPTYRYAFVPQWHRRLRKLFLHDRRIERRARLLGAPRDRLQVVGNLVADAVEQSAAAPAPGSPHLLLMAGSRDPFALHLIPFMIAVADILARRYPEARFVWPVSRLLADATVAAGIAGRDRAALGGAAGRREGNRVIAPGGAIVEMVAEEERYAHMRVADLALTIPGTNTLELGIAGVPSVVVLPMNRPELIPLEGPGHWLSLLPLVGTALKRQAVRLFVERLDMPVSLPNRFSGEELMLEIKGKVSPAGVAAAADGLLADADDLARRRRRLRATMPEAGAAQRLVEAVLSDA